VATRATQIENDCLRGQGNKKRNWRNVVLYKKNKADPPNERVEGRCSALGKARLRRRRAEFKVTIAGETPPEHTNVRGLIGTEQSINDVCVEGHA